MILQAQAGRLCCREVKRTSSFVKCIFVLRELGVLESGFMCSSLFTEMA